MPLWKVYHPETAYSAADKKEIATGITKIYSILPKFYVGVVFQPVPQDSFYIGGEPANDFVRIWVDHIARQFAEEAMKERFLSAVARVITPFTSARGLRWEMHVDETPFSLWTIEGLRPPLPNTPTEQKWREENRATAY